MISRVTQQTISRSTLANVQMNLAAAAALQNQMSSGTKISKPSDDPSGTSDVLRLQAEQRATTQYQRNANDGTAWLSTIDSTLSSSVSTLQRARDLAVQSGNTASMSPTGREALATEIDSLKAQLMSLANTKLLGRNVFAGTSNAATAIAVTPGTPASAGPPPVAATPATYTANDVPGATVQRRVSADTTVRVDASASAVFGSDTGGVVDPANPSAFALLDKMAAEIRSGTSATVDLTAIDARLSTISAQQSAIGAQQNQITNAQTVLGSKQVSLSAQVSSVQDVDLAEMILKIQQQSVTYQGALAAAGKSLQPSLMDYLK